MQQHVQQSGGLKLSNWNRISLGSKSLDNGAFCGWWPMQSVMMTTSPVTFFQCLAMFPMDLRPPDSPRPDRIAKDFGIHSGGTSRTTSHPLHVLSSPVVSDGSHTRAPLGRCPHHCFAAAHCILQSLLSAPHHALNLRIDFSGASFGARTRCRN